VGAALSAAHGVLARWARVPWWLHTGVDLAVAALAVLSVVFAVPCTWVRLPLVLGYLAAGEHARTLAHPPSPRSAAASGGVR
jgi:hypothetical protein